MFSNPIGNVFWSALLSQILTAIGAAIKASIEEETFFDSFKSIINFSIPIWILLLVVFVLSIIVIFLRGKKNKYDEESLKIDKELFSLIRDEILPQEGSIRAVRDFDSAVFYKNKDLKDLRTFEYKIPNSDFVFIHPLLEELKLALHEKINDFYNNLGAYTVLKERDIYIVLPEVKRCEYARYKEIVRIIDHSADQVIDAYDNLIREGRRILKI